MSDERVLLVEREEEQTENKEKFNRASQIYKFAAVGFFSLFIAFVLGSVIFAHSEFTSENFKYLVKYIDKSPALYSEFYDTIEYSGGDNMKFGMYKGDLCVLNVNELSLFGISGKSNFSDYLSYSNPQMIVGDQNIFVYSNLSNSISVFNSFSKIHEETFLGNIKSVVVSKNGHFAVLSSENDYRSSISVFNNSFMKEYVWKSHNKYTIDFDLSSNGKLLSILQMGVNNGISSYDIELIDTSKGTTIFRRSLDFKSKTPCSLGFIDKNIFVVFDNEITLFNQNGEEIKNVSLETEIVSSKVSNNQLLVLAKDGGSFSSFRIICITDNGEIKFMSIVDEKPIDYSLENGKLYILSDSKVLVFENENEIKRFDTQGNNRYFVVFYDESILLCYSTYTQLLK